MSKESIVERFATMPCGHVDRKVLEDAREMTSELGFDTEYQSMVKEIIPWALDGAEDPTEEEKIAYIATRWLDYIWYPEGSSEGDLPPCADCDQEKLRRWIGVSQGW